MAKKTKLTVVEAFKLRFEIVLDNGWWKFRDRYRGTFLEDTSGHIGFRTEEQAKKSADRFPYD